MERSIMSKSNDLGYYFCLIDNHMEKTMNEALKKYDLTKSQQDVLGFLHHTKKEFVIQKDIEEHFHISNPTVTGLLNRLEQKGFIERIMDPRDKRSRIIVLTEKEVEFHDAIENHVHSMESRFDDVLGDQKDILLEILKKITDSFEREDK